MIKVETIASNRPIQSMKEIIKLMIINKVLR